MIKHKIAIVSDRAVSLELEDGDVLLANTFARELASFLNAGDFDWLEGVKVFQKSLIILYNPSFCLYKAVKIKLVLIMYKLEKILREKTADKSIKSKVHCIPVCYSDVYATDGALCAEKLGISRDELIKLHTERDLIVMGHLYYGMANLSPVCARERMCVQAKTVRAGDVLFDGRSTTVATADHESECFVIGHTYVKTYDTDKASSVLAEGDFIRFVSVGENKFKKLSDKGSYDIEIRKAVAQGEDHSS